MGWLRSNISGLIALVVAAGIAWFVFWISFLVPEVDQYSPHSPVVVPNGRTGDFVDARFTVVDVITDGTYLDGSPVPEGTIAVFPIVEIDPPDGGELHCDPLLRLDGRYWPPAENIIGFTYDGRLEGTSSTCYSYAIDRAPGDPYRLAFAFLVPEASWDGFSAGSLDLGFFDEYPEFLRLQISR